MAAEYTFTGFAFYAENSGGTGDRSYVDDIESDPPVTVSETGSALIDGNFNVGDTFIQEVDPTDFGGSTAAVNVEFTYQGFLVDPTDGASIPVFFADDFSSNVELDATFPYGMWVLGIDAINQNFTTTGEPRDIPATLDFSALTVGDLAMCFLAGTKVATPKGPHAVEDLRAGDIVLGADGQDVQVKWLGHQTLSSRFIGNRGLPVRIAAGALGPNLPQRDLCVTADHALLIDGLLINAGALINGTTVVEMTSAELGDTFTVYHIETENHEVILAEGAAAETYIDYVQRQAFDNYAEYVAIYGEDRSVQEMPYPRIASARLLPAHLKTRLGIVDAA